ncbi:MAG TPA: lipopolysaccharide biosynthesis protein [Roseiflexaceae bacterium]|nr:lipopolysaccharide biosynthesis protein [Roseiflexaceae bacterium]HMP38769.1 lipopolysaccharide biosynthesis protein [Roseiflexaceae bacterium]
MEDVRRYRAILGRRRGLLIGLPLLVACISLLVGFFEPPRYALTIHMLVTRSEDRRFDTEDALAYDLPAIISGEPFAAELAAVLTDSGRPFRPAVVRVALSATNTRRVVALTASAADPLTAALIAHSATDLIIARGMALWGDPAATAANTGLNVVVLDKPTTAVRINGSLALLRDTLLRALLGLVAAVAITFASEAWVYQSTPAN